MIEKPVLLTALVVALSVSNVSAQEPPKLVLASISDGYSCEEATKIKFDQNAYEALELDQRVIVEAQYASCDMAKRKEKGRVAIAPNPVATDGSNRIFYGIIRERDLENAEKNCEGAGVATAIVLAGMGEAEAGQIVYQYGDVSCESIANGLKSGNVLTLVSPTQTVGLAVTRKALLDTTKNIPVISDADKEKLANFVKSATEPVSVVMKGDHVELGTPLGGKVSISIPSKLKPPSGKNVGETAKDVIIILSNPLHLPHF